MFVKGVFGCALPLMSLYCVTAAGGSGNRIFVGFVSRFFYRHSILKLMEGMIARLPRSRFYVVIFVVAPPSDAEIHHVRGTVCFFSIHSGPGSGCTPWMNKS